MLKGGNALSLVHGLSERTSLDLDFSMDADFADVEDARRRIFYAVKDLEVSCLLVGIHTTRIYRTR